jgi:hypothetical protein
MMIDHRYTDSTDSCDCITSTIAQIGDLPNLCNRAYAAGDKNLCICGRFSVVNFRMTRDLDLKKKVVLYLNRIIIFHARNLTTRSIIKSL